MSVLRRDKRTFRRVRPRRVGAGMVALLALGTGAGCGQSLLRPNSGPGLAAESLGLVATAIPSRKLAWVGSDGRRDQPYPSVMPSREPVRLNGGLETAVAASGTTWNGWKVPPTKATAIVAANPVPQEPATLPEIKVAAPLVASSESRTIPLPVGRRGEDNPEVETLLAASRETKIAPPLTHLAARPASPVVEPVSSSAPPLNPVASIAPTAPQEESAPPKSESALAGLETPVVVETKNEAPALTLPVAPVEEPIVLAESKPETATQPAAPAPVPVPTPASSSLPMDATTAVTISQVEEARPSGTPSAPAPPEPNSPATILVPVSLPTGTVVQTPDETSEKVASPVPPPAEIDPLTAASETTGIPLPKRPDDAEVATVTATAVEPVAMAIHQDAVAGASPAETNIPMPISPVDAKENSLAVSEKIESPSPEPAAIPAQDPFATVSSTTDIPMPSPLKTPMADPLEEASRTTNIPLPIPVVAPASDPLDEASRTTNIPLPIPVVVPASDPLDEASRMTNIPMPVPVSRPSAVLNPLIEASRTTQIPLPIPPEHNP